MKFKKKIDRRIWVGVLVLLVGGGLLVAGCSSDSVAPNDTLPAATPKEAAQQAALVAVGVAKVGPQVVAFNGTAAKVDGVYPYTFPVGGDISGSIVLEYFTGGPTGTHSLWDVADYGKLYTPEGEMVTVALEVEGIMPTFSVTFDLYGPIDRAADTATVSGTGTFTSGDITDPFTLTNVLLEAVGTYPDGGTLVYSAADLEVTVTYDGTNWATVDINDVPEFLIDLDTGEVTPIGE